MQIDDFKSQFKQFADRVDARNLRERGIIFVTILVALYMLAVNLLFKPLQIEKDRQQQQLQVKRDQIQAIEAQLQSILSGGAHDPDAAKRERFAVLQQNLKTTDTVLAQVTTGLVPPKEMARLVEQMLLKSRGIEVIKVESLPAAPLIAEPAGAKPVERTSSQAVASGAMVYKHGMRLELKGNYLDILNYLRALEGLPWKVFWGQATLQTEKYPISSVSLLIYTLSTHEGWIAL